MRYLEIIAEAQYDESFEQYVSRLRSLGIKQLGNGLNSLVFAHPELSNVAVKVFHDDDLGYREYLKFSIQNPGNKYLTTVLDTEDFADERESKYVTSELHANWNVKRGSNPPYSIVFLEKLEPVASGEFQEFAGQVCEMAGYPELTNMAKLGKAGWEVLASDATDPDLRQLAVFLVQQIQKGHKLDIGREKNFLKRGNTIVFIDPFY